MRLTKIKLSGFKSFVDSTQLSLPSNLVAIVGPNGAGKSNVIDAISYVLGESSPRYLRGESLMDVIFNGSTARKPVGLASVELIFDNSDGTLTGEYAKYTEISIKRTVERDADSAYYLNGSRCRKRDIADLLFGTGLGPRSYAMIGQNMINHIVEAKPDELRNHLEEAAGISKYKERRHETALKIEHTKENMARLTDVCVELEKQLTHLQDQANKAEKYKTLKQEERQLRAELYSIEWRTLHHELDQQALRVQQTETALQKQHSLSSEHDRQLDDLSQQEQEAQEVYEAIQQRYYNVANQITRIEQNIVHHEAKIKSAEQDLEQIDKDSEALVHEQNRTATQLKTTAEQVLTQEPLLAEISTQVGTLETDLKTAESNLTAWQTRWDEYHRSAAQQAETLQAKQGEIKRIEQKIEFIKTQLSQFKLQEDQAQLDQLQQDMASIRNASSEAKSAHQQDKTALEKIKQSILECEVALQNETKQLKEDEETLQQLRAEEAMVKALQQTALGQPHHPDPAWIKQHALESKSKLVELLEVEKGWEAAVAIVLGDQLQGICVDEFEKTITHLSLHDAKGALCLLGHRAANGASHDQTRLSSKVKSTWPITARLASVYLAHSLHEALQKRDALQDHESIITQEGVWLGRDWLQLAHHDDPKLSIFQRESKLKQLTQDIEQSLGKRIQRETQITTHRETLTRLRKEEGDLQSQCNQLGARAIQVETQLNMKQERLHELTSQLANSQKEEAACQAQLASAHHELEEAKQSFAAMQSSQQEDRREILTQEREEKRQLVQHIRTQLNQATTKKHEIELLIQTAKSQQGSLTQHAAHLQSQWEALSKRKSALSTQLAASDTLNRLKTELNTMLSQHGQIEIELNEARLAITSLDETRQQIEEAKQAVEEEINQLRTALESLRLETQTHKVKLEMLSQKIQETDCNIEEVLKTLPEEALLDTWQAKLNQVTQRINRLGAINLVAIDEYATCQERKVYLDKQMEDLRSGLAMLEEAIEKIDRETRARFKETFDQVNQRFQELFQTIFGGGKAYLELIDSNLLESGVSMMACPPGKRNSSIHLLSGGEKALTALAFVFSIFYLNPAPFCLLDEVDAALDDMNVINFTRLVKTMSEKTQFIFISHNKMTIEMATCLVGVTMNEPGVSRLVSVDIEKAMSLASEAV
jgi:chromosome segregation protein